MIFNDLYRNLLNITLMKKSSLTLISMLLLMSLNAQTTLTTAVDFTVTDVHGNTHTLFDYLADGKHVVIDFFFTTCGPFKHLFLQ